MVISVASGDTGAVTVAPSSLSFAAQHYNTPQTVTVTPVNDTDAVDESVTITHTVSLEQHGGYAGETASLAVTVVDDSSTAPLAPTKPTVTAGGARVALTWTSGGDGGSAITRWQYVKKVGANAFETTWTDVPGSGASTTSYTVTGLSNGTAYRFKVRAVNVKGNGPASPESDSVTPVATAPLAPSQPTVTGGNARVALTWTSGGDGGSAITRWQYVKKVGANAFETTWTDIPSSGASTTSYTVTGLTNDTAYQFKVRAVNGVGNGPASPESNSVTPTATVPPAPTQPTVTGGNARVTLTWTSGGDGGSAITKWQYVKKVGTNAFETTWTDIPSSGVATPATP